MNRYYESVDRCLDWIESQMLSFHRGSVGVYERIRIDVNRRVCWTRPDCNAEIARVYYKRRREGSMDIYENIVNWLLSVQDADPRSAWYGTFPFYLFDGQACGQAGQARYQNDNGKVLIALLDLYRLSGDARLKDAAIRLADYWVSIQRPEGYFYRRDNDITQGRPEGPCFVFWLAAGIAECYAVTGEEKYLQSVRKAVAYLLTIQTKSGRFLTTYELLKGEDWRPPSSESTIAVFCFARILRFIPDDDWRAAFEKTAQYVLSLQHESGGILNSDEASIGASLQENRFLCDLVYTEGFALMGFVEAFRLTGEEIYRTAAKKLADFLVSIQCRGESPLWDGAWRGTYNPIERKWDGRADQHNSIDEGGMYSVYTGWCAATIMDGLLGTSEITGESGN